MRRRRQRSIVVPDKPRERPTRTPLSRRGYETVCGGTGNYRLLRLPTADEQARGEWPDRDDEV